jgi:hypothetical protein
MITLTNCEGCWEMHFLSWKAMHQVSSQSSFSRREMDLGSQVALFSKYDT